MAVKIKHLENPDYVDPRFVGYGNKPRINEQKAFKKGRVDRAAGRKFNPYFARHLRIAWAAGWNYQKKNG